MNSLLTRVLPGKAEAEGLPSISLMQPMFEVGDRGTLSLGLRVVELQARVFRRGLLTIGTVQGGYLLERKSRSRS